MKYKLWTIEQTNSWDKTFYIRYKDPIGPSKLYDGKCYIFKSEKEAINYINTRLIKLPEYQKLLYNDNFINELEKEIC